MAVKKENIGYNTRKSCLKRISVFYVYKMGDFIAMYHDSEIFLEGIPICQQKKGFILI